jgi:hypothetical protein
MSGTPTLEEFIARLNQNLFFREFSFSQTKFAPVPSDELELADHVVWLDDLLLTFQLKERQKPTGEAREVRTPETERKWFENKVLKKATKQVKDTQRYLASYPHIHITNEKGHTFDVRTANINTQINVILHDPDPMLPYGCRLQKHHISSTAGFMHLMLACDYAAVCQVLVTPAEIREYLLFREQIVTRYAETCSLSEECLLGQFLAGDDAAMPGVSFAAYPPRLRRDRDAWDCSVLLELYEERIIENEEDVQHEEKVEQEKKVKREKKVTSAFDYYRILQEMAKLNRQELYHVKLRFQLCLEKCQQPEVEVPYRVVWPRTGCGFVFVPVPSHAPQAIKFMNNALENFTMAHKYDQKLDKCIGVAVASEKYYRGTATWLIAWCLIEEQWAYDAEMHARLRVSFPFREVRLDQSPRYHFD